MAIQHHFTKIPVDEKRLTAPPARRYGIPSIDLRKWEPDPRVLRLIPRDVALTHHLLPIAIGETRLYLAMADPANILSIEEARRLTGYEIETLGAPATAIIEAIYRGYRTL